MLIVVDPMSQFPPVESMKDEERWYGVSLTMVWESGKAKLVLKGCGCEEASGPVIDDNICRL